jgi:hypothetical protein
MNTVLDQLESGMMVTRGAWGAGERSAAPAKLLAGRPLCVKPEWLGLGGYLLGWTAALSFCSGLCGLAVSSAFEVAVPRWFILAYGAACALLALLPTISSRSWQQLQTSRQPDCGFLMGENATALWATGKESMACFSCRKKRVGSFHLESPLPADMNRP